MDLAIVVFPTPGGPVSRMTIPFLEFMRLFLAMNSKMRSLVSLIP